MALTTVISMIAWVTDVRGDHDKLDICKVENLRDDQISLIAVTTVVVTIL
jgi:hypothetical protein